jgi:Glycosyl transferase family 2
MKIAYLNPWENAAENQAYFSMAAAARHLGHELVDCRTANDIELAAPEFVLSVASSIPKVVDVPTYLTVHEPTNRFLGNPFYLKNFLTYDGYLTISDSLRRFVQEVSLGAGRPIQEVGFYYNTPQASDFRTDLSTIVNHGNLKIVYIGTNWDRRMPSLFRALDNSSALKLHGPHASWDKETYKSYCGPLPFDGVAPQKAYAESGIGLVLLSAEHLREDVISNRIFEISSVGALSICPATPWIRKWFGDSVLYFDPGSPTDVIAQEVLEHYHFCKRNPEQAQAMADTSRSIFEKHFAAERLIENAIKYHFGARIASAQKVQSLGEVPEISVVIRCGGRPIDIVRRAVDSIKKQTFGKFSIIFSKYRQIDLSEIVSGWNSNISSFTEIFTEGGSRTATLAAGCRAIKTEYFAVLDDDDFWLSDHIETLFSAGKLIDPSFDVAFSGTVSVQDKPTQIETSLRWDRNIYTFGFRDTPRSIEDISREFASNCFVARSELLLHEHLEALDMHSAEDSVLIGMISRRKRPTFSYKATAFFSRKESDHSNYNELPSRKSDLLSFNRITGSGIYPQWLNSGSLQPLLGSSERSSVVDHSAMGSVVPTKAEIWVRRTLLVLLLLRVSVTVLRTRGPMAVFRKARPWIVRAKRAIAVTG